MSHDSSRTLAAEPFVRLVTRVVGGVPGRHAGRTTSRWWNPLVVAYAIGTLAWLLGWLRWLPCRQTRWDKAPDLWLQQCYSDIVPLYAGRGLADGNTPYFDTGPYQVLEYPVGTGYLMELARLVTKWLGAPQGPGLDSQQVVDASNRFMAVNAMLLFALFLVAIWAAVRGSLGREWDALMFVASPSIALTGLINWDMLPVALTALGVMLWARGRPALAGVALGLSMAAKLYAGFLLGPLLLLCLRGARMKQFASALGGFLVAWAVVNLPVMVAAPEQWKLFWTFNADREGDFGSIWYLGVLLGAPMPNLNFWSTLLFLVGCLLVGALILLAPTRPRLGPVCFLVLMAFLMTNKVYSPQYVLWALPFLALSRPKWRDWIIWTAGEWLYFMAIWGHLGDKLKPGGDGVEALFFVATILRLATEAWVVVQVVRAVWDPRRDIVRASLERSPSERPVLERSPSERPVLERSPSERQRDEERPPVDDPSGGPLDGAPDAPWFDRLRRGATDWLDGAYAIVTRGAVAAPGLPGVRPDLARSDRAGLRWVFGVWLATRLLLLVTAIWLVTTTDKSFAQLFANWDVQHFVAIAEKGYLDDSKRMAFFPGLPLVLAAFTKIGIPAVFGGMLVSLVCSALAAWALYRLGGVWAAALWLVAPTMVFTFVPYTEAMFCAFAFWAWVRAREDRWALAGLFAAGAASIRVSGLFLVFALAVMVVTWPRGDSTMSRVGAMLRRGVWLVLPVAVIGAYMVYLHGLTGSWNAWNQAQQAGWSRGWTWPWTSVMNTIPVIQPGGYADHPGWATIFRFEVISMMVGLVATGWLLARRLWAEAAWIAVQVLAFSTSYWLFSVNRAVLLWFPVWVIAAELVRGRPEGSGARALKGVGLVAWVVTSVWVGVFWAKTFYLGQWSS